MGCKKLEKSSSCWSTLPIWPAPDPPNTRPIGFWSLQVTSCLPDVPFSRCFIQGHCNHCPYLIVWPTEKKYPWSSEQCPVIPHKMSCSLRVSNFRSTLSSPWDPPCLWLWWWDLNQPCLSEISSDHGGFPNVCGKQAKLVKRAHLFINEVSPFQKPVCISAVGRTSGNGLKLQLKPGMRETLQVSRVGRRMYYFWGWRLLLSGAMGAAQPAPTSSTPGRLISLLWGKMGSQGFPQLSSPWVSISKSRLHGDIVGTVKLTQTSSAGMGVQCLTWIMASKVGKWPSRAPEKHNLERRQQRWIHWVYNSLCNIQPFQVSPLNCLHRPWRGRELRPVGAGVRLGRRLETTCVTWQKLFQLAPSV